MERLVREKYATPEWTHRGAVPGPVPSAP